MPYMNDSDKPIYVNADKSKVVEAGSPDAAFLLVGPGGEVSDEDARKYGLRQQEKAQQPAEDKAQRPAADKAVRPAADKGA